MKINRFSFLIISFIIVSLLVLWTFKELNYFKSFINSYKIGQTIDNINGVKVYYNGGVGNISGRSWTNDNYNLGLKYQCVEFVKRYYYQHLGHKMPDSYGHAKEFFDKKIKDGSLNKRRNLTQFTNPSFSKPQISDLVIFSGTNTNKYGHVAIISNVSSNEIEIIQQNPGIFGNSRARFSLRIKNNKWTINNSRIMGWLRKE